MSTARRALGDEKIEAPHGAATLTVRDKLSLTVVQTLHDMEPLEGEWNALFAASPAAAPPLRWRWVLEWWRHYGEAYGNCGNGLRILVLRRSNALVGLFPLYEGSHGNEIASVRRLTAISAGAAEFEETAVDSLDPLYAPGEEAACSAAIANYLAKRQNSAFDEIVLPAMRDTTRLQAELTALAGWNRRVVVSPSNSSFYCDMGDGFEGYLNRLSTKTGRNARRLLRQSAAPGMEFTLASTAEEADEYFDQLVALHQKHWQARGKLGSFAPRHAAFHRAVLRAGVAAGEVVLARLAYNGIPVALNYGHRANRKFYGYQLGLDTTVACGIESVGVSVILLLMRHMAEQGVTMFDLQGGANFFKEKYGSGEQKRVTISITRLNARSISFRISRFLGRVFGKLRKVADRTIDRPNDARMNGHPQR